VGEELKQSARGGRAGMELVLLLPWVISVFFFSLLQLAFDVSCT